MAAGLELFATVGYGNSSVRALCAEASLNSRYFYEAFESREDLLYNVYQRIVGEIVSNVAEAVQREHDLVDQTRGAACRMDHRYRGPAQGQDCGPRSGRCERAPRKTPP